MTEHIASTLIVIPNWAIYTAMGMWAISTALYVVKLVIAGFNSEPH